MDAKMVEYLAKMTTSSIADALKHSKDLYEALKCSNTNQEKLVNGNINSNEEKIPGLVESQVDSYSRNLVSDLASFNSSGITSQRLGDELSKSQGVDDKLDWLYTRDGDTKSADILAGKPRGHSNSSALLQDFSSLKSVTSDKYQPNQPSKQELPLKQTAAAPNDEKELTLSAWKKGQSRLINAIQESNQRQKRNSRRSLSVSSFLPGFGRDASKLNIQKDTQKKKLKLKKEKQNGPQSSELSLSQSLSDLFGKRSQIANSTTPVAQQLHRAQRPKRQKERDCLQIVESLLQLFKQVLSHPSLASDYFNMIRKMVKDFGHFLDHYRSETTRPFDMNYIDHLKQLSKAILEDSTHASILLHMQKLFEIIQAMQQQLTFFLYTDKLLPVIDDKLRLTYFSEYCYMVLEDFNKIASNVTFPESTKLYINCHLLVLLSVMRYYLQNSDRFGGDIELLKRCYTGIERLQSDYTKSIAYRLKVQIRDVGSDLTALCECLINELQLQIGPHPQPGEAAILPKALDSRDTVIECRRSPCTSRTKSTVHSELRHSRQAQDSHSRGYSSTGDDSSWFSSLNSSVERMCQHLKRLLELHIDDPNFDGEGKRLSKSIQRFTRNCNKTHAQLDNAFKEKLSILSDKCEKYELKSLSFEFLYALLSDALLFQRSLVANKDSVKMSSPPALLTSEPVADAKLTSHHIRTDICSDEKQDIDTLLSLISSIVCDLYLVLSNPSECTFSDNFQTELRKFVGLVDKRGTAFLDSVKKQQLRQTLLKLIGHMKSGGGTKMTPAAMETLIRLLLEIRLHLGREHINNSQQLWEVKKCISFPILQKYLSLRNSRVTNFRAWIQDTPQLRKLVNPFSKDPSILRIERQCKCSITINDQYQNYKRKLKAVKQKICLLTVDLAATQCNYTACIRMLTGVLEAKHMRLEPHEATVSVTVQL